jgi:hypothetical protein
MRRHAAFALALVLLSAACKRSSSEEAPEQRAEPASARPAPDGKYENVLVDGKRVPMVQVMNGAEVLLVDTDGVKPRTWEEQYKRKGATLQPGQFDLHKTDVKRDGRFDDDPIDRQGRWQVDEQGNLRAY